MIGQTMILPIVLSGWCWEEMREHPHSSNVGSLPVYASANLAMASTRRGTPDDDRATHWHDTEASATRNYSEICCQNAPQTNTSADRSRL